LPWSVDNVSDDRVDAISLVEDRAF